MVTHLKLKTYLKQYSWRFKFHKFYIGVSILCKLPYIVPTCLPFCKVVRSRPALSQILFITRPHQNWSQSDRHASFCVTFRILHQIARVIPAKRNDYSIVKAILRMNWSLKQSFIYFVISNCFNPLLRWNNWCPQEISRLGVVCVLVVPRPLCVESLRIFDPTLYISSLDAKGSFLLKR